MSFFVTAYKNDGSAIINAYKIINGKAEKLSLEINIPLGIKGHIMRADKNGALLLKLRSMGNDGFDVKITGMESKNLGRYKSDSYRFSSPIIADIDNDGFLEIIATNDIRQVVCYKKSLTCVTATSITALSPCRNLTRRRKIIPGYHGTDFTPCR